MGEITVIERRLDASGFAESQSLYRWDMQRADSLRSLARQALMRVADAPLSTRLSTIRPDPQDISSFCACLLSPSFSDVRAHVERLQADGYPKSAIVHGHIAEAARLLGAQWQRDEVTFAQVGHGTGRLQRLCRFLRAETVTRRTNPRRRVLFATMPGETHTLGVFIAADSLREKGWRIDLSMGERLDRTLADLMEHDHAVLGVSLGSVRSLRILSAVLPAIRRTVPGTPILVSGPLLAGFPAAAEDLPVDAVAADFGAAVDILETLSRRRVAP